MTVDDKNNTYYSSSNNVNNSITQINSNGIYVKEFMLFRNPRGIVYYENYLYVAAYDNSVMGIYTINLFTGIISFLNVLYHKPIINVV